MRKVCTVIQNGERSAINLERFLHFIVGKNGEEMRKGWIQIYRPSLYKRETYIRGQVLCITSTSYNLSLTLEDPSYPSEGESPREFTNEKHIMEITPQISKLINGLREAAGGEVKYLEALIQVDTNEEVWLVDIPECLINVNELLGGILHTVSTQPNNLNISIIKKEKLELTLQQLNVFNTEGLFINIGEGTTYKRGGPNTSHNPNTSHSPNNPVESKGKCGSSSSTSRREYLEMFINKAWVKVSDLHKRERSAGSTCMSSTNRNRRSGTITPGERGVGSREGIRKGSIVKGYRPKTSYGGVHSQGAVTPEEGRIWGYNIANMNTVNAMNTMVKGQGGLGQGPQGHHPHPQGHHPHPQGHHPHPPTESSQSSHAHRKVIRMQGPANRILTTPNSRPKTPIKIATNYDTPQPLPQNKVHPSLSHTHDLDDVLFDDNNSPTSPFPPFATPIHIPQGGDIDGGDRDRDRDRDNKYIGKHTIKQTINSMEDDHIGTEEAKRLRIKLPSAQDLGISPGAANNKGLQDPQIWEPNSKRNITEEGEEIESNRMNRRSESVQVESWEQRDGHSKSYIRGSIDNVEVGVGVDLPRRSLITDTDKHNFARFLLGRDEQGEECYKTTNHRSPPHPHSYFIPPRNITSNSKRNARCRATPIYLCNNPNSNININIFTNSKLQETEDYTLYTQFQRFQVHTNIYIYIY